MEEETMEVYKDWCVVLWAPVITLAVGKDLVALIYACIHPELKTDGTHREKFFKILGAMKIILGMLLVFEMTCGYYGIGLHVYAWLEILSGVWCVYLADRTALKAASDDADKRNLDTSGSVETEVV